jgi:excisionase family DNA binding protein
MQTVNARELAGQYNVAPTTIRKWARQRVIPSLRPTNRTVRFDPEAVAAALEQKAVSAARND